MPDGRNWTSQVGAPALSGGIAVCFSHPLELTKVRLQLDNERATVWLRFLPTRFCSLGLFASLHNCYRLASARAHPDFVRTVIFIVRTVILKTAVHHKNLAEIR